jgi:type VI secretion system protein ImpE
MTQLKIAADLDAENLPMAHVCGAALNSEALRGDVFSGERSPLFLGEPQEWVGWILQANQMAGKGHYKESQELRERAFDRAPAVPGSVNGHDFEWIADADPRLGPILEVIVNGAYYWVPFSNIHEIEVEPPTDLRDLVWLPAQFTWANGGQSPGLIPTRYPSSEASEDAGILMARKTEWMEKEGGLYLGLGQRVLATDEAEFALLDIRQVRLSHGEPQEPTREANDG